MFLKEFSLKKVLKADKKFPFNLPLIKNFEKRTFRFLWGKTAVDD